MQPRDREVYFIICLKEKVDSSKKLIFSSKNLHKNLEIDILK